MKKLFTTESLIVAAVIFTAIFFAKFPTLYHFLNTPKGFWYPKNTSWFDAWDINTYVSYIRYGQRKGVLLENTYTTTAHKKEFIFQYYTSLGVLNKYLRLDPFFLFHISSVFTSILLILTTYFVIKIFIEDQITQTAALIIAILGGGLGWLRFLQGADVVTAGFTMVNAFERGHDGLSTVLILLSTVCIYLFAVSPRKKYVLVGVLTTLGSIAIHPPFILLYVLLSFLAVFIKDNNRKRLISLIYPFLIIIVFSIYFFFVLWSLLDNIGFSGVGSTLGMDLGRLSSLSLTTGFGLIFVFIIWGLVFSPNRDNKFNFLKLIFLTQLYLCFLPMDFNLYFTKGFHVWGVILGLYGVNEFFRSEKIRNIIITTLVFFSVLTRIYIYSQLMNAKTSNSFFFLSSGEGEAITFMSRLPGDSAILSLYRMGNYIPAHTDNKVYYGHKFMTPDGEATLKKARTFYTLMDEKEQREFVKENKIAHIYYGLEEAQLRIDNKLIPQNPFSYFPVLYSNDSSIVYDAK